METPGYEADINRIYVHTFATPETVAIAYDWDQSPQSLTWSRDSSTLYTVANDRGRNLLIAIDVAAGCRTQLTICSCAEDFWFAGARGDRVHAWIVRPYGFDRQRRYSVALLLHGGPQQANVQGFGHGLWNPNICNFTDSVRHKRGDYPYVDAMRCIDYVSSHCSFVDRGRIVALGGSFGGYLVNWPNGHIDRFRALVAHTCKFSTVLSYYGTDKLWFPEHDLGKLWEPSSRVILEENNPESFTASFKTPYAVLARQSRFSHSNL
ncbi:dipeptidylpeptidase [Coemansia sp. RSA 988]|nr:dipeptidylpeptidase [Coemansia sp. RSA 988]